MSGGGDAAGSAAVSSLARALEQKGVFDAEAVASLVLLFNKYIRDDKPPKWPLYDAFEALREHGVDAIELTWDPKFVDVWLSINEMRIDMKDLGFKFAAAPPNSKAHETLSKCIGHEWWLDHQAFDVEGREICANADMRENMNYPSGIRNTHKFHGGGEKHWDPLPYEWPDEAGGEGALAGFADRCLTTA
jgi:hypothetical protein